MFVKPCKLHLTNSMSLLKIFVVLFAKTQKSSIFKLECVHTNAL